MSYRLTAGWPVKTETGEFVNPETNPDYLAWLEAGNTPEPATGGTLADLKAALLQAATSKRWEVETGGINLTGLRVATAKADQDRITSVMVNAAAAGVTTVDFKAESGWITLSLAQIQTVASSIALHVQACFSAERAHHEAVEALVLLEDARAYDVSTGWPGSQQ